MQINKTDANDAHGIAHMMRTSFFKEVTVKSLDSHRIRTFLGARAQLVGVRTDLKNQVRSVAADANEVVVGAQIMGTSDRQTKRDEQGQGRRGP
jgi:transposase